MGASGHPSSKGHDPYLVEFSETLIPVPGLVNTDGFSLCLVGLAIDHYPHGRKHESCGALTRIAGSGGVRCRLLTANKKSINKSMPVVALSGDVYGCPRAYALILPVAERSNEAVLAQLGFGNCRHLGSTGGVLKLLANNQVDLWEIVNRHIRDKLDKVEVRTWIEPSDWHLLSSVKTGECCGQLLR
jgi:hypothetical protein